MKKLRKTHLWLSSALTLVSVFIPDRSYSGHMAQPQGVCEPLKLYAKHELRSIFLERVQSFHQLLEGFRRTRTRMKGDETRTFSSDAVWASKWPPCPEADVLK